MWGRYSFLYLKDLVLRTIQGDIHRESQSPSLQGPGCLEAIEEIPHEKCSCPKVAEDLKGPHEAHDRYRKTTHDRGLHRMIPRNKREP